MKAPSLPTYTFHFADDSGLVDPFDVAECVDEIEARGCACELMRRNPERRRVEVWAGPQRLFVINRKRRIRLSPAPSP